MLCRYALITNVLYVISVSERFPNIRVCVLPREVMIGFPLALTHSHFDSERPFCHVHSEWALNLAPSDAIRGTQSVVFLAFSGELVSWVRTYCAVCFTFSHLSRLSRGMGTKNIRHLRQKPRSPLYLGAPWTCCSDIFRGGSDRKSVV